MTLTPGWYHSHTPEPDTVYDRSRLRRFRLEDAISGRVYGGSRPIGHGSPVAPAYQDDDDVWTWTAYLPVDEVET